MGPFFGAVGKEFSVRISFMSAGNGSGSAGMTFAQLEAMSAGSRGRRNAFDMGGRKMTLCKFVMSLMGAGGDGGEGKKPHTDRQDVSHDLLLFFKRVSVEGFQWITCKFFIFCPLKRQKREFYFTF